MKNLLIILLLPLFLNSCNKCKDGHTRIGVDTELDDALFFFQEGSYWIMKENVTGQIDTLKAGIVSLHIVIDKGSPCYETPNYDATIYKVKGGFFNKIIHLSKFGKENEFHTEVNGKTIPHEVVSKTISGVLYNKVYVFRDTEITIYWVKDIGPVSLDSHKENKAYSLLNYAIKKNTDL